VLVAKDEESALRALEKISESTKEDFRFLRAELSTLYRQRQSLRQLAIRVDNLALVAASEQSGEAQVEIRKIIHSRSVELLEFLAAFARVVDRGNRFLDEQIRNKYSQYRDLSKITFYSTDTMSHLLVFYNSGGADASPAAHAFSQGVNAIKKQQSQEDSAAGIIEKLLTNWQYQQNLKHVIVNKYKDCIQLLIEKAGNGSAQELHSIVQQLQRLFFSLWSDVRSQADILSAFSPILARSDTMDDLVEHLGSSVSRTDLAGMIATFTKPSQLQGFRRAVDKARKVFPESKELGRTAERTGDFMRFADVAAIRRQEEQELQVKQAYVDHLTRTLNRRGWMGLVNKLFEGGSCAVIIADVDKFGEVNKIAGHQVGDLLLQRIAQSIKASCRAQDIVGRYGGEEFIIFLPQTNVADARVVAERIRSTVEKDTAILLTTLKGGEKLGRNNVTITLGVADSSASEKPEKVIDMADGALKHGKEAGRNRVVVHQN